MNRMAESTSCAASCAGGGKEERCSSPLEASALSPPAFNKSERPMLQFPVGFTCSFTNSPKELRTDCPICLYILREPHQAACCGTVYCKLCIERVRSDLKPCPTCRNANFEVFPDRNLRNSLYSFKVTCAYKDEGCKWMGELRYIDDHLNVSRKHEQRFFGCEYVKEDCFMCDKQYLRSALEEHEMKNCPRRQYTCEYCSDYSATFEEVAERHWPACPERSVPCKNECGIYPARKNLEYHLQKECHLREPESQPKPLKVAREGGDALSMAEVQEHIESTVKSQLTAFATDFLKKAIRDEIGDELKVVEELRREVETLKQVREESAQLRSQLERLTLECREDRVLVAAMKPHLSIIPVTFTLDDYENRLARRDMGWTSPSFYTHPCGYRMRLLVDVGGPTAPPNSRGVYMSAYLNFVKGEHDSQLKWPFRGSVTISLLSEGIDKSNRVEVIRYNENTPAATSGRILMEDKASKPWGKGKFIRHDDLTPGGYVNNDKLTFYVSKVEFDM